MTSDRLSRGSDDRFVDAAMRWLRTVLVAPTPHHDLALPDDAEVPPDCTTAPSTPSWYTGLVHPRRRETGLPALGPGTIGIDGMIGESATRKARQDLVDAMASRPRPRFTQFCDRFELVPFERDVLLLCFAHAISTEIARLCAAMPESVSNCPTFALALGVASDPAWDATPDDARQHTARRAAVPVWEALGPDRPLRLWRILEIVQPGGQALVSSPLRADERIVNHLMGRDYVDDRIAPVCRPVVLGDSPGRLSESQRNAVDRALDVLRPMAERRRVLVVQLPGGDGPTKRLFAAHLATQLGLDLHRASVEDVSHIDTGRDFVRLWNRERYLQDVALHLDASSRTAEAPGTLERAVEDLGGLVLLDVPEPVPGLDTALVLDAARPTPLEQHAFWHDLLGGDRKSWAERLSGQFNLNFDEIAGSLNEGQEVPQEEQIWTHYRSRSRACLEGLAQRVTPTTTLDDVQLPEEEKQMLRQLRDQARHRSTVYDHYGFRTRLPRGLGITALFAGESGTGKSMAAEALAHDLDLDLYRIDLASVVSKYIGETEKNLKRVFVAAEQSGAVLLFDEADALFGKRSEVQDSHDRYANIEVSYLLQLMESYMGLAILTTNMKSALDLAFLRRLRIIVTFPFPGLKQRRAIWLSILPSGLPGVEDLDLDALATPGLTGGQIRNVAVNAAFRAAAAGRVITMEHLRDAAHDELRKHGRPFSVADFAAWRSWNQAPTQTDARETS